MNHCTSITLGWELVKPKRTVWYLVHYITVGFIREGGGANSEQKP